MKLINLRLRNFKGIKDLSLEIDGKDLNVYGENGRSHNKKYYQGYMGAICFFRAMEKSED